MAPRQTPEKRKAIIAANSLPEPQADCIPCGAGLTSRAYGKVMHKGKCQQAHRLAFAHANGLPMDAIAGLNIMHTCDYRPCVNPSHLLCGTHQENMAQMVARGRAVGHAMERNSNSRLTRDDARAIRAAYSGAHGEKTKLAKLYGVSSANIGHILAGRLWKNA